MTDQEYRRWLRNDAARRTVLLEIDTTPVRRISLVPFTTLPTDSSPNIRYDALIKGGISYREELEMGPEGGSSSGYASIQLHNEDGSLDTWADEVWKNRAIRVYFGDVSWSRDDYRLVVVGVIESFEVDRDNCTITLRDPLDQLNEAVTEQLLGGSGQEADELMPLVFGECHNIKPRVYDAANHTFQWNANAGEQIIEVRDRGVPVSYTSTGGRFSLLADPDGEVTASVQGDAVGGYTNRIGPLIQRLVTRFGPAANRFTAADLDTTNLAAFDSAHPQPVGLFLDSHTTVIQSIVELANSVGAQVVMSRLGKMRLLKVQIPAPGSPSVILPKDYEDGSLTIETFSEVVASVRLGYCRNWTPGQDIAEGIPLAHRERYAQEWFTVRSTAPGVASEYRIGTESEQINTLLLRRTDAQPEAARRLALWSVPRVVYRVRGFAQLLELELGQAATLYGSRFGLDSGKTGQIIGLEPDWVAGRCNVEVMI